MIAAEAAIRRAATATIIRPAGVYGDPRACSCVECDPEWEARQVVSTVIEFTVKTWPVDCALFAAGCLRARGTADAHRG